MTTGAVDLCNQALRLLGEAELASFDEETDLANTCGKLYPDSIAALLAGYPWRFTLAKAQLARLAEAPLNEWRYAHALPADLMTLREITASGGIGAAPLAQYERFEDRIFADQPTLWCDYQRAREPATWPPAFRNLARHALAADFAVAVTGSASLADFYRRICYGTPQEGGNGGLMGAARRLDAQQQPPQAIRHFPLISARFGGA